MILRLNRVYLVFQVDKKFRSNFFSCNVNGIVLHAFRVFNFSSGGFTGNILLF